jgi:hypothetical protein
MDKLTPELERRLQVEELWARRNVLADSINSERKRRFLAQYVAATQINASVAQCVVSRQWTRAENTALVCPGLTARMPTNDRSPTASTPRQGFNWRRTALLGGLTMATAAVIAFAPIQRLSYGGIVESEEHALPVGVTLSAPVRKSIGSLDETLTRRTAAIPDLRAEVATEIITASQRQSHDLDAPR